MIIFSTSELSYMYELSSAAYCLVKLKSKSDIFKGSELLAHLTILSFLLNIVVEQLYRYIGKVDILDKLLIGEYSFSSNEAINDIVINR